MEEQLFDKQKLIDFWTEGSKEDFETMVVMFDTKRYQWALFIGHLMLEKLLKAYYVKVNERYPPFTHNLLKLAKDSKLSLNDEKKLQLTTITAFNLNARYDDYKRSFYKKCSQNYTKEWLEKTNEISKWIKELIK